MITTLHSNHNNTTHINQKLIQTLMDCDERVPCTSFLSMSIMCYVFSYETNTLINK